MNKYLTLFGLSFQKQLEVRSDFIFERARSVSILLSLYFLWSALLTNRAQVLDYSREQLLTYVFVMTLLRAFVLACTTDRIPMEIAKGNLSDILLKPISHLGYWATQDAANKLLNMSAAVLEVGVFLLLTGAAIMAPAAGSILPFVVTVLGGMVLYFQMSYLLGVLGFWTAQSWGPRFCFEVLLEFCAGAFFPIDLLPGFAQRIINLSPFPYLIFHPLSIYLGRHSNTEILQVIGTQLAWILILGLTARWMWKRGMEKYAAEGR